MKRSQFRGPRRANKEDWLWQLMYLWEQKELQVEEYPYIEKFFVQIHILGGFARRAYNVRMRCLNCMTGKIHYGEFPAWDGNVPLLPPKLCGKCQSALSRLEAE